MPPSSSHHQPSLAFRVDARTLLLAGPVDFALEEDAALFAGKRPLAAPGRGCVVETPTGPHYLLLLEGEALSGCTTLPLLTLRQPEQGERSLLPVRIEEASEALSRWVATLAAPSREAVFSVLMEEESARMHPLCLALQAQIDDHGLALTYARWLTPSVLYGEYKVGDVWLEEGAELLLLASDCQHRLPVTVFQIAENTQAFIALADEALYKKDYVPFRLSFLSNGMVYALSDEAGRKAYGYAFIERLKTSPAHQITQIREALCQAVLAHYRKSKPASGAELLQKLQYYVPLVPSAPVDAALPFNLYVENVLPIGSEGVFLSGWMRDPLKRLKHLRAIADLGMVLECGGNLHRFARPDVAESYRNSPYGGYEELHGFVAYVPLNKQQQRALAGMAQLHSFRFEAELCDGTVVEVVPEARYRDAFAARDFVLRAVPAAAASDALLHQCIAPAAQALQRLCMAQVSTKEVLRFGKEAPSVPEAAIIIPLYKRLEYLKPQLACFAADADLRECELIYVLDSPEQAQETTALLKELCALYPLAVTLVIMQRNSGYAAANNSGAAEASAEMLLFMNSDILPHSPGWLGTMLRFYEKQAGIGALAPKLLYEDDSLQHAGMVFEKKHFPFWLNLHQWKGYPAEYPPAGAARVVPAVTGACLMVHKALFAKVDGFTTDYVIGDFEDSDLCLKLAEAGYDAWYLPEAALYHLERQSVPLNEGYQGSYAWQVNARLHTARWDAAIAERMQAYEAIERPVTALPGIVLKQGGS